MLTKRSLLLLAVILPVSTLLLSACGPSGTASATPTPSPIIAEKFNLLDIQGRPYVVMMPTNNGRSIRLGLNRLANPVQKADFEIEYQTDQLLQGFGGGFNVTKLPDAQDYLLGSCSAGGKCTYNENVTGGALTIHLTHDSLKDALKNEWAFIENKDKSDTISSRDAKFILTGKGLPKVTHFTILQTPGYPAPVTNPLSLPYNVGSLKPVVGSVTVAIRLNDESPKANILGWDGKKWVTLKAVVADKVATAISPVVYETYIAAAL